MKTHVVVIVALLCCAGCTHQEKSATADSPSEDNSEGFRQSMDKVESDAPPVSTQGASPALREQRYRDALSEQARDGAFEAQEEERITARLEEGIVGRLEPGATELSEVRCGPGSCLYLFTHADEVGMIKFHPMAFQEVVERPSCFVRLHEDTYTTFAVCARDDGTLPAIEQSESTGTNQ